MDKETVMPCRSCKHSTDETYVDSEGIFHLLWIKCEKNLIPKEGNVFFSPYGKEGECKNYQHNEDAW